MRCILSLLALGITLVMTAGQEFTLKNIKVAGRFKTARDQWSMKGNLDNPTMNVVPVIGQSGLTVNLLDASLSPLASAAFAATNCKLLRNARGVSCKSMGARVYIKRTRRPKAAKVKSSSYNSTGGYYAASGMFRRLQFLQDTVVTPLTVQLVVGTTTLPAIVSTCSERTKSAGRITKITCTPTRTWTEQTA
ncbi:hypothetical protein Naga_101626g1, partial [Nannochloropsis gaditana]